MQVYEICKTALSDLMASGKMHDMANGHGDYVVVGAYARFGHGTPKKFFLVENFENGYWACRRCKGMNDYSLFNALNGMREVAEYEVWHIVDDPIVCYSVVPYRKYEDRYYENIEEAPDGEFCFETGLEAIHVAINLASMTYPLDNKYLLFSRVEVIKYVGYQETVLCILSCPSKVAKVVTF